MESKQLKNSWNPEKTHAFKLDILNESKKDRDMHEATLVTREKTEDLSLQIYLRSCNFNCEWGNKLIWGVVETFVITDWGFHNQKFVELESIWGRRLSIENDQFVDVWREEP